MDKPNEDVAKALSAVAFKVLDELERKTRSAVVTTSQLVDIMLQVASQLRAGTNEVRGGYTSLKIDKRKAVKK